MNLTLGQKLLIAIGVLTVVGGSAAQLDVLFGVGTEKIIIAGNTIIVGVLSVVATVVTGQGGAATALTSGGGAKLVVGENASPALAAMAQPNSGFPNVVPEKGKEEAVKELAKQA